MIHLFHWQIELNPLTRLNDSRSPKIVEGYAIRVGFKSFARRCVERKLQKLYYNSGYNKTTSKITITDTI